MILLSSNTNASDIFGNISTDGHNRTICNCTRVVLDAIASYEEGRSNSTEASSSTQVSCPAFNNYTIATTVIAAGSFLFNLVGGVAGIKDICSLCRPVQSDPTMENIAEIFPEHGDGNFHEAFNSLNIALSTAQGGSSVWTKRPIIDEEQSLIRCKKKKPFLIGYKYSNITPGAGKSNIYLIGSNNGRRAKDKRIIHENIRNQRMNVNDVADEFMGGTLLPPDPTNAVTNSDTVENQVMRFPGLADSIFQNAAVAAQISNILGMRRLVTYNDRITVLTYRPDRVRGARITIAFNMGGTPGTVAVSYKLHIQHILAAVADPLPELEEKQGGCTVS